jgi:PleD family two-component response regulator
MTHSPTTPLVLLACSDEWLSRSFATVFEQHGYAVARVSSGARTIRLARRANPDVVVLEEGNGELDALRVCTALGHDPLFDQTVPIVITSVAPVTPETRHAAYAAGAWEYCSHPVDLEALMLKLATFRRARAEGMAKRGERFVDRETGLYTAVAFERLAEQVGARARRRHEPLACVTISLQGEEQDRAGIRLTNEDQIDSFATIAELCRSQARKSDIVAHMSESRLVILAPDTDGEGARLLIRRLRRALGRAAEQTLVASELDLRAGYSAVADLADSGLEPTELVRRATSALDHLQLGDDAGGALSFDELPPGMAD